MLSNSSQQSDASHIKYLEMQLGLARREINNLRQQVKSLNYVHQKECDDISKKLENWQCLGCKARQDTNDNEEGAAALVPQPDFLMKQIGIVNTSFPEKRGTPRQPSICSEMVAKLTLNNDVFTNPAHSVEGLQEFSHVWILFLFHKNDSNHVRAKVAPPRLNGTRTGVFATRSPHRPSPIGLSLVKIDRIVDNTIYFTGVDMIDGTPVIDVKPYIPQYDNPELTSLFALDPPGNEATTSTNVTPSSRMNHNRVMDGEENRRDDVLGAVSSTAITARAALDELSYTRLNSRIGEREAPDGEEEEPPQAASQQINHIPIPITPEGHIRVPSWIENPPVSSLSVTFKDRALAQLNQLGIEGEDKKRIISNVLREDPRSVYLRERWSSHCYVFRIAELYVSCKFNDADHVVTVYQVFQNAASESDE